MTQKKRGLVDIPDDKIKELEERESSLYDDQELQEFTEALSETFLEDPEDIKGKQEHKKLFVEEVKEDHVGYIELNPEIIPSTLMFYPEHSVFRIRGGTTPEIRTFSSYAQKDAYTVNQAINGILNPTVKFSVGPRKLSSNHILEMDKIFFLLAVRDLTFYHLPNNIKNPSICPKCNQPCGIDIFTNNTIFFEEDINLSKYYNATERCYLFTFDDGTELRIKPPTILTTHVIESYVSNKRRNSKKVNIDILENIKFLDLNWENMTEEMLDSEISEMYKWSDKKYSLFLKVVEDFKKQLVTKTFDKCNSCSAEVTVPFQFRSGLLSIFLIPDPYRFVK